VTPGTERIRAGWSGTFFGFVVRKRLNHAVLPALCKLEVAGSIPARSTFSDIAQTKGVTSL
jgi:hypothetical protein